MKVISVEKRDKFQVVTFEFPGQRPSWWRRLFGARQPPTSRRTYLTELGVFWHTLLPNGELVETPYLEWGRLEKAYLEYEISQESVGG